MSWGKKRFVSDLFGFFFRSVIMGSESRCMRLIKSDHPLLRLMSLGWALHEGDVGRLDALHDLDLFVYRRGAVLPHPILIIAAVLAIDLRDHVSLRRVLSLRELLPKRDSLAGRDIQASSSVLGEVVSENWYLVASCGDLGRRVGGMLRRGRVAWGTVVVGNPRNLPARAGLEGVFKVYIVRASSTLLSWPTSVWCTKVTRGSLAAVSRALLMLIPIVASLRDGYAGGRRMWVFEVVLVVVVKTERVVALLDHLRRTAALFCLQVDMKSAKVQSLEIIGLPVISLEYLLAALILFFFLFLKAEPDTLVWHYLDRN